MFDAIVSGTTSLPVFADVQFDANQLTQQGAVVAITNGYRVTLRTLRNLPSGASGQVTFRLCQDASCTLVYPASTQIFSFSLTLDLNDWQNFQRNSAQTGYVPLVVDPSHFTKLWEWTGPGYLSGLATSPGMIHLSSNEAANGGYDVKTYTLKSSDGSQLWSYDFGSFQSVSAPAVSGDRLQITTHADTTAPGYSSAVSYLWSFDRSGPSVLYKFPIDSLGGYERPRFSPTPSNSKTFLIDGLSRGRALAIDTASGAEAWSADMGTRMVASSVAASDGNRIYVYNGQALLALSQTTGALDFNISDLAVDPAFVGEMYVGSPVVGSMDDVLALSGPDSGGSFGLQGSSFGRPLVSYDLATRSVRWRSPQKYKGPPVIANGVVYAADNDLGRLAALDERTGAILWTWAVPPPIMSTPYRQSIFMGAAIATYNVVFVSTHDRIYGIDTSSHQTVWSFDSPGLLAISKDGTLFVLTAYTDAVSRVLVSNHKLVAIRLK